MKDCIDVLCLELEHVVEDPNGGVVVLDEVRCVFELGFVGFGVVERIWEGELTR